MIVFPAIDLKDAKCVRLYKGDMNEAVVYNENPPSQARTFEEAGFSWLHVVDLNGAIEGRSINIDIVREIVKDTSLKVQLGGGIRDLAGIDRWISAGVTRVILGTAAVRNPDLVKEACRIFPGKIVVGIDARNGKVAVSGWTETSDMDVIELVRKFSDCGVAAIIHTDIDRDGTGQGLNIEATEELSIATNIPVIASGGVASMLDLAKVKAANLHGVIAGRALYDGSLDLKEVASFR
ncbi:MAG: 1-(5-phosphoribosyl)-5-((5-phosphoribosylamino)methylideneamino)imidazole-4-carboxamide isomerase [Micavibrio aeruginosavorus]|uniref:1-(5-phosphoribosyl)-5-[(5-phosphoribosylamino)methylideneamino] imidazole-4-carboxamide isomerase n=1 Tax=Micavibrio aeruginosavorus TaxID=349221 RepID=A0A2W5FJH7_9BACT|nr:MAG: 1-(5-phosphoribosyl)-5-((5-phosphoribosylamino)methylideneamino)imidazole-4-carboxamide isomerase [Micavibrio aeruginosavorus]